MFLKFQGSGSDRLKLRDLYERLVQQWQPQTPYEQNLFGDALQAIGDVLQFLDRRSEALDNYQEAVGIYRQVGDRLGEANTLLGLGSLQDESDQAMVYFMDAQEIFGRIGDQYSQGRNLLMFIVKAQWQQGDVEGVMRSLDRAAAIGDEIGVEILRQVADQIRAELQSEPDA